MSHAKTQRRKGLGNHAFSIFFAPLRLCVRYFLIVVSIVIFSGRTSQAHSDPYGDIHPSVSVNGSCFIVTFQNVSRGTENFSSSPVLIFRNTFSSNGQLIKERESAPLLPSTIGRDKIGNGDFWISDFHQFHPQRLVSCVRLVRPKWYSSPITDMSLVATEYKFDLFCNISGQELQSEFPKHYFQYPFYLAKINLLTGIVDAVELGNPSRVYSFVRASEIRIVDNNAYVAWIWLGTVAENIEEKSTTEQTSKTPTYRGVSRLVLSRWNLVTGKLNHFFLPAGTDRDTTISMAAIKGKLLIAWHSQVPVVSGWPTAKIKTLFLNLSDLCPDQAQLLPITDFPH